MPSLPNRRESGRPVKLRTSTRDWWKRIWASPMAAVWLDADVPALVRLAHLHDIVADGRGTASDLAEMRQLEDRFGLSPMARRRLQWEVSQAAAVASDPPRPAAADDPDEPGDERFLRVVKG